MSFLQKIQAVWANVSLVQRALLVAVVLTLLGVGALMVHWAGKPDMRLLYQDLSPEEASKITEKISEMDIAYELHSGGTTIFAPKKHIYQLRLDMAKDGLPAGEQGGYKIFDDEKIGVSPFAQEVQLKRAMQEELAKSIQMIDGVVHARVHIVRGKQNIFSSRSEDTSASIILHLRPGYVLSAVNIAAITHLVAGGVEGLKSEAVTLIDSQGNLLSSESGSEMAREAGTVQAYKERVEQTLEKKVEDMLTVVLGPGRATVRVWASVDMNSISTITETFDPKGVVTKEEISSSSKPGSAGVSADGKSSTPGQPEKTEDITTEYKIGGVTTQETKLPGQIISLKVAAFVDLSVDAADANEPGGATAKIMQITDVEEIIKNALGLEDASSIKVVDVKFNQPLEVLIEDEPSKWPRYMAMVRQGSMGIMAVCAFLVLRIFRGAKQKAPKGAAGAGAGLLPGAGEGAGFLPGQAGGAETLALRKQIAGALQRNPDHAKQLFASWIEEKGD